MLVAALLIPIGLRSRYQVSDANGLVCRRPLAQCAFLGVMSLSSLLMPLVVASGDLRPYGHVRPDHWPGLAFFAAVGLAGAALFLWCGQPEELVLDAGRGTYRRVTGWPAFRRVRIGPLSDLAGVGDEYVGRGNHLVYVRWRDSGGRVTVNRFRSQDRAEHDANALAATLGVPRLAPPKLCRFLPGASPALAQQRLPLTPHGAPLSRLRKSRRRPNGCGRG